MLFHELRSQFTVIGGLCQRLLKNDAFHVGIGKGKDYLQVIGHSVNQVSELADETLLLSSLDTAGARLSIEECRMDEIVVDVLTVHQAAAQRKGIAIPLSPLPEEPCRLHRLALKVIISSLVENAVKYCPPHSIVTPGVAMSETQIRLVVQDQGPVIPAHEHQKIFAPTTAERAHAKAIVGPGSAFTLSNG